MPYLELCYYFHSCLILFCAIVDKFLDSCTEFKTLFYDRPFFLLGESNLLHKSLCT